MQPRSSFTLANRTLSEWFSSLPTLIILLITVLLSSGEIIHSQLLKIGENTWDEYYTLRGGEAVQKPSCDPDPDIEKRVEQQLKKKRQSGGDGALSGILGGEVSQYYLDNAYDQTGVTNVVTAILVGYRGFDRVGVDPLFPFGHGRSYAAFACGDASATPADDGWRLDVPVANDADRAGREVVQVYVSPPDGPVERPARTLGGFASVELAAGERERVSVSVPRRAFARYDSREGWTVDPGEYDLLVARSSRDVRERMSVTAE